MNCYLCRMMAGPLNTGIVEVHGKRFRRFIEQAEIERIVDRMAGEIGRDISHTDPLLLGVLNGSFIFAADLVRKLGFPLEISFVKYASYKGMKTTGDVGSLIGLREEIRGRHILVVEDIIDTGLTMGRLLADLQGREPASLRTACFCFKKPAFKGDFGIDYCGIEIPDLFVLGYGLDFDGKGRNYPDIYQLEKV